MKYTLIIILFLSLNIQAQKPVSVSRILEVTSLSYNEVSEKFDEDTIPIQLKTLNSKIIFTNDQLQIIDSDTTFITLGGASENHEDSVWVTKEWSEADLSGSLYYVYFYHYKNRNYNEVVILDTEDNIGYNYKLAPLKMDVIPTASNIAILDKKKKK